MRGSPIGSVAKIVKAHAARVGLDPACFSGHSLRSGFLTSVAARGASIFKMADQSRHRSMDALRGYVRDAEIFRDHAGVVVQFEKLFIEFDRMTEMRGTKAPNGKRL